MSRNKTFIFHMLQEISRQLIKQMNFTLISSNVMTIPGCPISRKTLIAKQKRSISNFYSIEMFYHNPHLMNRVKQWRTYSIRYYHSIVSPKTSHLHICRRTRNSNLFVFITYRFIKIALDNRSIASSSVYSCSCVSSKNP